MATPRDFDAYDLSEHTKEILANAVTELENANTRLVDQFQDLTDEIDALKQKAGVLTQKKRGLKTSRDANLATINEIYASLPPVPTP